jgi:hypothetical protein
MIKQTGDVYMSARKSMTVRTYVHSRSKRQEPQALLDSGATENFINLAYGKWLQLPIKRLEQPRMLINVDGTENKAGALEFYTDLQVKTGSTTKDATVLPLGPGRTQNYPRIPMVCGSTT